MTAQEPAVLPGASTPIARHKTAIRRLKHSRPVALAMAHGLIGAGASFFDYGCGRGEDFRLLRRAGIEAAGWDPHFRPDQSLQAADVVNLGYVLNVIEDPAERLETLRAAFELARKVLVVAVRVDRALDAAEELSDGYLTSRGAFQKLYTQAEFRDYLGESLGCRPHMASLGVAYVFRGEQAEAQYLANLSIRRPPSPRTDLIEQFRKDALAKRFLGLAQRLGRPPLPQEFRSFGRLVERFGTPARVERLAARLLDPDALAVAQRQRREDLTTYLAMLRLQGLKPPPFRALPSEAQADVRMLWPSYAAALEESERFLFQLGKPEIVRAACHAAPVGKKLPQDLYVHRSCEEQLAPLLRLLLFAARQVVGEVEYDLVKIALDGRKVSFLAYEDFDGAPHPALRSSVKVDLPRAGYGIRDYTQSENPPVLHRKETFVDPLHPLYAAFCALSEAEEARGLLGRPDIGFRKGWEGLLAEHGLRLDGHRLVEASADASCSGPARTS
jgi:DNA phosphorothioation-associated putative methyltransferase